MMRILFVYLNPPPPPKMWTPSHPRHLCRDTFTKFEMISTPTGRWIRSRQFCDRIHLSVDVEIISNFSNFHDEGDDDDSVHTLDGFRYKCFTPSRYLLAAFPLAVSRCRDVVHTEFVRTNPGLLESSDLVGSGCGNFPARSKNRRLLLDVQVCLIRLYIAWHT